MKTLVIAEKPSVARDIGKILKCNKKGEGFIYNDEYIISWAIGHLVTLCEPEEYDESLKKWSMNTLPIIPENIKIKPIKSTQKQLKILKNLMNSKDVEKIICATDSGREGELIFRYIYSFTKCKKVFYRLWISSLTDEAIKEGFLNLKPGGDYDNLYYSAKCRSEADWLVGINASRVFTLKFNNLLSIGRVQTPTLAILVNRQKEIDDFVPQEYFEIETFFEVNRTKEIYKGIYINEKNNTKILSKEDAKKIVDSIKKQNGEIVEINTERKKQIPPLLYDLTELQRDCNKKYGYSAQKTLSIAQDLYEKRKLITYPRTDSRYLSDDMASKLKGIIQRISAINLYSSFTQRILQNDSLKITKRIVDNSKVSDHHAIIPTNVLPKLESLSKDEFNVYNLIIRRFLAVFYPDYVYDVTKVITKVLNYRFLTKGNIVVEKGWTILNEVSEKDLKESDVLPNVLKGESVTVNKPKVLDKKTKPPKHYNEATLLSAMENAGRFVEDETIKETLKESGLGTPATRASIIERLIKIGYVSRKAKSLIPTEKGIKLIAIVPNELKSPETTGKWEKGLSSISKGNMTKEKFMGSIDRYVRYIISYAKNNDCNVVFEKEESKTRKKYSKSKILGKCPCCKGDILENSKAFYCTSWQTGCKFTIWKNALSEWNFEINSTHIKELLNKKAISNVSLIKPDTKEIVTGEIVFGEINSGKLTVQIK